MTNLPAGKELDAAVLAVLGFDKKRSDSVDYWQSGKVISAGDISTSDPEAMRLCGPWLDEHCIQWSTGKMLFGMFAHGWLRDERGLCSATVYDRYYDSLAEALCRLVLAVAAREAEQR